MLVRVPLQEIDDSGSVHKDETEVLGVVSAKGLISLTMDGPCAQATYSPKPGKTTGDQLR